MLHGFIRGRALTVGVSCLLHLGSIVALLLAERWIMSAHASKPSVLPVQLVIVGEPARPEPPPPPRKIEPPKPVPPKALRLPTPIDTPLPQMTETVSEPRPPEPRHQIPDPPPPVPASVATVSPPASPAGDPAPTRSAPGPGVPTPVHSVPADGPPDGIPVGRPPGPPSQTLASAPSRDAGTTGAITHHARPQGGYQVRPSYPSTARRLGIQGTTLLKVHVLVDGRVGDVIVQQTAGHPDLDLAAADAVRRWRFEPARRGIEAVAMWVLLPVEFRLK